MHLNEPLEKGNMKVSWNGRKKKVQHTAGFKPMISCSAGHLTSVLLPLLPPRCEILRIWSFVPIAIAVDDAVVAND